MHDGLVVVDKPAGFTSHDVVAKLRKAFGQKRVGHAGTLDPDATGVLLVGLGRVTRLLRFLQDTTKTYRGTIAFGVATDTLDAAGAVLERRPMPLGEAEVVAASRRFLGELQQVPPMVSALKVDGRRLHELARAGEEVERKARAVRIDRFDVERFEPGPYPSATVLVECSSGTYVRSLAADLGAALGGPAHLASLRRLRVGPFSIDEAHPLDEIERDPPAVVVSPAGAMRGLERVVVGPEPARAVAHGSVFSSGAFDVEGPGPYAVVDERGELLAVYERRGAALKPAVVLPPAEVAGP
jgi:tRNA pseudouridine55 synthase